MIRNAPLLERLASIDVITEGLEGAGYIPSRPIVTAVHVAAHLEKPIPILKSFIVNISTQSK